MRSLILTAMYSVLTGYIMQSLSCLNVLTPLSQLALWCYYFRAIASFERESADIGDARATAQDLFNSFTKRLCKITLSSRAQTDVCTVA